MNYAMLEIPENKNKSKNNHLSKQQQQPSTNNVILNSQQQSQSSSSSPAFQSQLSRIPTITITVPQPAATTTISTKPSSESRTAQENVIQQQQQQYQQSPFMSNFIQSSRYQPNNTSPFQDHQFRFSPSPLNLNSRQNQPESHNPSQVAQFHPEQKFIHRMENQQTNNYFNQLSTHQQKQQQILQQQQQQQQQQYQQQQLTQQGQELMYAPQSIGQQKYLIPFQQQVEQRLNNGISKFENNQLSSQNYLPSSELFMKEQQSYAPAQPHLHSQQFNEHQRYGGIASSSSSPSFQKNPEYFSDFSSPFQNHPSRFFGMFNSEFNLIKPNAPNRIPGFDFATSTIDTETNKKQFEIPVTTLSSTGTSSPWSQSQKTKQANREFLSSNLTEQSTKRRRNRQLVIDSDEEEQAQDIQRKQFKVSEQSENSINVLKQDRLESKGEKKDFQKQSSMVVVDNSSNYFPQFFNEAKQQLKIQNQTQVTSNGTQTLPNTLVNSSNTHSPQQSSSNSNTKVSQVFEMPRQIDVGPNFNQMSSFSQQQMYKQQQLQQQQLPQLYEQQLKPQQELNQQILQQECQKSKKKKPIIIVSEPISFEENNQNSPHEKELIPNNNNKNKNNNNLQWPNDASGIDFQFSRDKIELPKSLSQISKMQQQQRLQRNLRSHEQNEQIHILEPNNNNNSSSNNMFPQKHLPMQFSSTSNQLNNQQFEDQKEQKKQSERTFIKQAENDSLQQSWQLLDQKSISMMNFTKGLRSQIESLQAAIISKNITHSNIESLQSNPFEPLQAYLEKNLDISSTLARIEVSTSHFNPRMEREQGEFAENEQVAILEQKFEEIMYFSELYESIGNGVSRFVQRIQQRERKKRQYNFQKTISKKSLIRKSAFSGSSEAEQNHRILHALKTTIQKADFSKIFSSQQNDWNIHI